MFRLRSPLLRVRLVPALILLLLLAQGLRLCIHATAMSGGNDFPTAIAAAVHLENNLGSSDDAGTGAVDHDVPASLLINLALDLAFAVIATVFLVSLLPARTAPPQSPADFRWPLGGVPGLRPPLRAPPR